MQTLKTLVIHHGKVAGQGELIDLFDACVSSATSLSSERLSAHYLHKVNEQAAISHALHNVRHSVFSDFTTLSQLLVDVPSENLKPVSKNLQEQKQYMFQQYHFLQAEPVGFCHDQIWCHKSCCTSVFTVLKGKKWAFRN